MKADATIAPMIARMHAVRSALFVPASNPRAIAKAAGLGADLVILDLEDAVADPDKGDARLAAVRAAKLGFGNAIVAIRVNASDRAEHAIDCRSLRGSGVHVAVLPKTASPAEVAAFRQAVELPVLLMIETASAVIDARALAASPGVVGLIAGTNDLCAETGIRNEPGRAGLALSLQMMVLAARAAGVAVFDGVYNQLADTAGFEAEARQGVEFGFTGKALIHPDQVDPANRAFSPSAAEVEDARALVAAAGGGATRFRDRMVEALHVEQARRVLERGR